MDADGVPHSQPLETTTALDRRALIKRAAVAGAVAWTAPAVVGSLASPAGALTATCTYVAWDLDACGVQKNTNANDCPPTFPTDCPTTATSATATSFCGPAGLQLSCPTAFSFRMVVPSGCSCTFLGGTAKGTGTGGCVNGVVSGGGTQLDFTWASSQPARVWFFISC